MKLITDYVDRVHDYLCDPFFPKNDKYKPWVIVEALFYCLTNQWMYEENATEELLKRIKKVSKG